MLGGTTTGMADDVVVAVEQAVARQILLGLRESLTIAGQLGRPVEEVNDALTSLRVACEGCIALMRPYPGEPRVVIMIVDWQRLKRIGPSWVSERVPGTIRTRQLGPTG